MGPHWFVWNAETQGVNEGDLVQLVKLMLLGLASLLFPTPW